MWVGQMPFSTEDADNDQMWNGNCASIFNCGWWFNYCSSSNLNGIIYRFWHTSPATQQPVPVTVSRMMLRCDAG